MAIEIEKTIAQLTLAEKIEVLAGGGACSTIAVPRLGIPKLQTSDGPHGIRGGGGRFFNPPPGYLLPSATAMGATFDTALLHQVGRLLGGEAKRKGVHVALAPTVCIQRSPLLGRGFEAFSDDPVLSGTLAAQYIAGLQELGIAACIKHYAAHDQSIQGSQDSVVMSQRTLREIHLLPFQLAFIRSKEKPWAIMTAYNRINGVHVSEDPMLINQVLRTEWKFDGLVMSDWWGTYSTSESLNAGMDLEMPGPTVWRGRALVESVLCRKVTTKTIDSSVRNLLKLINRTEAWNTSGRQKSSPVGTDTETSRKLVRKLAADSLVLLKNDIGTLPLDTSKKQRYGLIGEHFVYPSVSGGGSSESNPFYISTPLEAIKEVLGDANIQYLPGHYSWRWTPIIKSGLTVPQSAEPGLLLEWFGEDPSKSPTARILRSEQTKATIMYFSQMKFEEVPAEHFIRVRSTFTSDKSCKYRFGLSVCGRARLTVNGKEVVNQWKSHPEKTDETPMFNKFTMERFAYVDMEQGGTYDLEILMTNTTGKPTVGPPGQGGVRLGGHVVLDEDKSIEEAVELARNVDVPIIMVGLSSDYEYEGTDRMNLLLPGRQNELVEKVARSNPKTIVVTQAGMPFSMPWLPYVNTLVHAWFGGQECGNAISDVLFGHVNPSGKLSITFPDRLEDTPAFLNFGKSDNVIVYGEGVYVGHRFYEKTKRDPLFYFGYGLSYTRFQYSELNVPDIFEARDDFILNISVDIQNVGERDGQEVIQVYVADLEASVQRPRKELKAFTKVRLAAGEKRHCTVKLDKYALSFWSEYFQEWRAEAGDFEVIIARSSDPQDELLKGRFTLPNTFMWTGL